MELVFEQLVKHYGSVKALRGVSFTLSEGVHGLLGPNGAGKSTMMNILSGNLEQTSGSIRYNGTDIRTLGNSFRSILGFMPQQQALYPGFTAVRFLCYMAALRGMTKRQAGDAVPRVLEQVALSQVANRPIRTFSGGMKQRLLIAQAILADPDVLILDEPTAGLDPKQRIAIRNLIASIAQNKIVIVSTHVVADIACIARDILLLKEGQLIRHATPTELNCETYGTVWEKTIPPEELQDCQSRYKIANVMSDGEGYCLRILSEIPIEGGCLVKPNLEDVYLSYFEE